MADKFLVSMKDIPTAEVPESQRRRVERDTSLLEQKKAAMAEKAKANRKLREELRVRTLERLAEKEKQVETEKMLKAEAKVKGGFYRPAEPKVMFVIRIKGVNKIAPKPRKVFHLFRLLQIHNGVFIKVNKSTMTMLKLIEPFVAYGYPNEETIRRLIYKRGCLRVGRMGARQRIRIQHNEPISEALGKYGVHGAEDIIHELATAGPHFKEVSNSLWTFKLRPPRGGYLCKRHGFAEMRKGDWGNREDQINDLIRRML